MLQPDLYREELGAVLGKWKFGASLRQVIQVLSYCFPTQNSLKRHLNRAAMTGLCRLCGGQVDSIGHIQCACVKLKRPLIQIHHDIWHSIVNAIRSMSTAKAFFIGTELTLTSLNDPISSFSKPSHARYEILQGLRNLESFCNF